MLWDRMWLGLANDAGSGVTGVSPHPIALKGLGGSSHSGVH